MNFPGGEFCFDVFFSHVYSIICSCKQNQFLTDSSPENIITIETKQNKTKQNERYARWSLGFVNPPLEISGTGSRCKITALNIRGQVLLEPVLDSMNRLKDSGVLSKVSLDGDVIEVEVVPPSEVGSFSEEERSRQVSC